MHSSGAVLLTTLLIAFLRGLGRLVSLGLELSDLTGMDWIALILMTAAAVAAAVLSPRKDWRRIYSIGAVAMTVLGLLMMSVVVELSIWRKLEVLLVGVKPAAGHGEAIAA